MKICNPGVELNALKGLNIDIYSHIVVMLFAHEVDNSNRCNNWANEKRSVFDKYNYCFKNCGKKPENLNHYIVNTSLTPEKTEIKNMSLKNFQASQFLSREKIS